MSSSQRQLAYASASHACYSPEKSSSWTKINPDELSRTQQVKLASGNSERDLYESLAEVYSIIVTIDALERAYLKDAVSDTDYTESCARLLQQYKSNLAHESVSSKFGTLDAFKAEWGIECPRATERIRVGLPATVEQPALNRSHGQSSEKPNASLVVTATENFITLLDAIKIGMLEKDMLHPLLVEIIQAVNNLTDRDFQCKGKIVEWLITLNQMRTAEKLPPDQARELQFDMQQAYHGFKAIL